MSLYGSNFNLDEIDSQHCARGLVVFKRIEQQGYLGDFEPLFNEHRSGLGYGFLGNLPVKSQGYIFQGPTRHSSRLVHAPAQAPINAITHLQTQRKRSRCLSVDD